MRIPLLLSSLLVMSACVQPSLSKIDYRTFKIDSGGIPGGSDAPNRRLAEQVCPNGYRVLAGHRGDGGWRAARHTAHGDERVDFCKLGCAIHASRMYAAAL
jgi:hypothetical protein